MHTSDSDDPAIAALWAAYHDAARGSGEEAAAWEALRAAHRHASEEIDLGAWDRQGRRIGVRLQTWQGSVGGRTTYHAHAHATRGGDLYQASHGSHTFDSPGERAQWRDRYVAGARKRAEKARAR